jgi:hypothetical protein
LEVQNDVREGALYKALLLERKVNGDFLESDGMVDNLVAQKLRTPHISCSKFVSRIQTLLIRAVSVCYAMYDDI